MAGAGVAELWGGAIQPCFPGCVYPALPKAGTSAGTGQLKGGACECEYSSQNTIKGLFLWLKASSSLQLQGGGSDHVAGQFLISGPCSCAWLLP